MPASRADVPAVPWVPRELLVHMGHDKKVADGRITFVLARGIGQAFLTNEVAAADVLGLRDEDGDPLLEKVLDVPRGSELCRGAASLALELGVPAPMASQAAFPYSASA